MSTTKGKRFSTVGFTAPTAMDGAKESQAVKPSPRQAAPASKGERISFTWRLTPEQADQLDTLVLDLRRQLGRGRLDRAAMLLALVDLVRDRADIQADLADRLGL